MTRSAPLRRLVDLPGVRDLEYRALLNPRLADPILRADYPEVDACAREIFGLGLDEADAHPRPQDWDDIERLDPRDQVEAFEAEGWDVTDDKRRPLRLLAQFSAPLWLAVRGVAGSLPFQPEPDEEGRLTASLAAEASRFRKNKI